MLSESHFSVLFSFNYINNWRLFTCIQHRVMYTMFKSYLLHDSNQYYNCNQFNEINVSKVTVLKHGF